MEIIENNNTITTIPLSSLNELFAALAKAQSSMPIASKDSDNPFFKSKYADFAEVIRVSRPSLAANGLTVLQRVITLQDGSQALHTVLGHSSGQYIDSLMRINPPKNDVQAIGSYITYLKRYSYAALVGVCSGDEDDDGEAAMQRRGSNMVHDYFDGNTITQEQLQSLTGALSSLTDGKELERNITVFNKVSSLKELTQEQYPKVLAYLKKSLQG